MAMPTGRLASIATVATRRLSQTAVHSCGERSSRWPIALLNVLRGRGAGRALRALPARPENNEALALERRTRRRRADIGEERLRVGAARLLGQRDRIDDRRMRVLRERAHDLDARIRGGIGLVDDAERSFAARYQHERGAHGFRLRQLVLDAVPGAELLQRRLAVLAGRHRIDIGRCQPAALERRREVEAGPDVDAEVGVLRRDQHQPIAQQVRAGVRLDQVLLLAIVHPVEIRRDEDVGRRPLLDLLDERVAGRIGNRRLLAGLALPLRGDLVERVLQARSGEHENVAALCCGRTGACGPCQDRHGRQGEPATPRHYHYKPPGALYSDISSEHSRILRRFNAGTGQNCRGTALRQGFSLIAWADGRYLNSAQARVSQAGSDAARLETVRHQPCTLSSEQSSLTAMPAEKRVQRSNSNTGTAITSGVSVSEAVRIAAQKPRPAASSGPKRLTITASTPRLIDAPTSVPV